MLGRDVEGAARYMRLDLRKKVRLEDIHLGVFDIYRVFMLWDPNCKCLEKTAT